MLSCAFLGKYYFVIVVTVVVVVIFVVHDVIVSGRIKTEMQIGTLMQLRHLLLYVQFLS